MKKVVFIFASIFCLAIGAYTQNVPQKTISVNLRASPNTLHNSLRFNREGSVFFTEIKPGSFSHNGRSVPGNHEIITIGRYYIDNNNVAHITWDNGFQETAQIRYDSNNKVVCAFRLITLYERFAHL